jgi:hypothetical protein
MSPSCPVSPGEQPLCVHCQDNTQGVGGSGVAAPRATGCGRIATGRSTPLLPPHLLAPDIHIFTATKLPWVTIPDGARAMAEYDNPKDVWPADSLARFRAARAAAAAS